MANKILISLFLLLACQISSLAQPIVELGQDTVLCGSTLLLDAGNPGATFLWNDGSITQTINADTTGTYWVMVTDLSGTTSDTIEVELVAIPATPVTPDTAVCGFPSILLSTSSSANFIIWSLDSTSTPSLGQGKEISYQVTGNKSLLIESKNVGGLDSTGFTDPAAGPSGNYFALPTGRGMRFDVLRNSNLESVTVYASAGSKANISLTNSSGVVLQTKEATFNHQGANDVYLGFSLVPGSNYRLILENPIGTYYLITSTAYSFPINQIELKRGQPLSNQYPAFFNWKLSDLGCPSGIDTAQVTSLFQPSFDLGNDTILCSATYQLDLSTSGGVTYLWSDSSVSAQITVDSTSLVWGEAESSGCVFRDSVMIEILETPSSEGVADTTICGTQELTLISSAVNPGDLTLWYNAASGGEILSQDTVLSVLVEDTTTYFLERFSLPDLDTLGYSDIATAPGGGYFLNTGERGLAFDVLSPITLLSVDVFATPVNSSGGVPPEGRLLVRDGNGMVYFDQRLSFPEDGRNTVYLNLQLQAGTGYEMILVDASGKYYLTSTSDKPFIGDEVIIQGGIPIASQFNYFFNWRLAKSLCSSGRIPTTVNVILPNRMADSVYSCDPIILQGPTGTSNYLWSTGATTPDILADSTQTYTVSASDSLGCTVSYEIDFSLPKQIDLGDDGNFCGNTLESGYSDSSMILWSTGDTTSSITTNTPGEYWVLVNEPRGCTLTDTVVATSFSPIPVVFVGNDTSVCTSLTIGTGQPILNHLWSTGDTTTGITVTASGLYTVLVSDSLGCSGQDTIGISVTQIPVAGFSVDTTGLSAAFFNSSGFGSYLWDFGDNMTSTLLNPVHTYQTAGIYTVRLIASNECGSDTIETIVQVKNPSIGIADLKDVYRARILTESDGNATLHLEALRPMEDLQVTIFDLQGKEISQTMIQKNSGEFTMRLTQSHQPAGIYFLRIESSYGSSTLRFIQQ